MDSVLPFHGPLHWALTAVSYVAVLVVVLLVDLRRKRLSSFASPHVVADQTLLPPAAVAHFARQAWAEVGFRPLGVLTLAETESKHAFAQIWVDPTSSTLAQSQWVQRKAGSRPRTSFAVLTMTGDRLDPQSFAVGSTCRSVTSGNVPGSEALFVPGRTLAELTALHARQLAQHPAGLVRLPCESLAHAARIMDWLANRSVQWRVSTGRFEHRGDGSLRLSWQQCFWCITVMMPPGPWLYRRRMARRGAAAVANWSS